MAHDERNIHDLNDAAHARLAHEVMRRQGSLSIRIAAVFLLILFGLPLVNNFKPDLANTPVLGFTATWLFLGVLFYPLTWLLSWMFIKQSDRIEAECSDWRAVLGTEAGELLEPEGVGDVKPAFIESDVDHHPPALSSESRRRGDEDDPVT